MKKYTLLLFLLFISISFAQFQPKIDIKGKNKSLNLSYLDVKVQIQGNYALSTYIMKFYNGYNRVLEGELKFPLSEKQRVVDFAMEVNGKLRQAVVVEKEIGRVAYETTVRRKIDPALLTKTEGNNYRVRVYPILANSHKLIQITIEEELRFFEKKNKYSLSFDGQESVDNFSLDVDVVGGTLTIDDKTNKKININKSQFKNHQIARIKKKNVKLSEINYTFFNEITKYPIINTSDRYFNITTKIESPKKLRKASQKISLLWDTSLSMMHRDLKKEVSFLDAYFSLYPNIEVQLIKFSNEILSKKRYFIKSGNWQKLKQNILNSEYDGATNYNALNNLSLHNNVLLFTDGLGSFNDYKKINSDLVLINSIKKANYNAIYSLGGKKTDLLINLNTKPVLNAVHQIKYEPLVFMGLEPNKNIYQTYSSNKISSDGLFSVSGKAKNNTEIKLLFGDGKTVFKQKNIKVALGSKNKLSLRLWAKQKLEFLRVSKKENKEKIINHAKEYKLITDYTSLIVLDRLQDYLKYKIQPPESLQKTYESVIKERLKDEEKEQNNLLIRQSNVQREVRNELVKWYLKNTLKPKSIVNIPKLLDASYNIIQGNIRDINNEVLIGASVLNLSNQISAVSDFDGNFKINANTGDKLRFNYLGCLSKEIEIQSNSSVNVKLESDSSQLDEVVVIGYGIVKKKEITGAIVTTEADDIVELEDIEYIDEVEEIAFETINNTATALQGQVSGVRVRGLQSANTHNKKNTDKVVTQLKAWNSKAPYINKIKKVHKDFAYKEYLNIRKHYLHTPTFFIDVADYFFKENKNKIGLRILSNLLEMDLGNYELLKAIAYKLLELKEYELAIKVNSKIVEIRSEDPQSYRDLALAYQANHQYQKSFDLLYRVYSGEFLKHDETHRFNGIEQIAFVEICKLIKLHSKELKLTSEIKDKFKELPVDIRVVVDWNHNDTDLDLWVIDPNGEKCYYKHKKTKIGGRISNDMTAGFGPEEFLLKNAIKGDYTIKVKYYSDTKQKISGPTALKLSVYTNFGTSKEIEEVSTYRLTSKNEVLEIGNISF